MILLAILVISMITTVALIPIFKRLALKIHAMDIPNGRTVHSVPVPRTGGIAMALGAFIPILFWAPPDRFLTAILTGAGIVVLTGIIDDIRTIGFKAKFSGQLAAALIMVVYGGVKVKSLGMLLPENVLLPDWLSIPVTLLFLVGVTNSINLSDGLDGLAGGISLLSFVFIGYLAFQGGNISVALLSATMVGAIIGFLRFNTYPAILFMGDAGSQLLGFLAGTLSLVLTQGSTPLSRVLPLVLLGFPLLDTLMVMCERIYKGRSPFSADKNHFHHKLIQLGFFHKEAVLVIYLIQASLVTFAFIFRFYSEWFLLVLYAIFSVVVLFLFYLAGKTGWKLKRYDIFDKVVKGRLRILKRNNILIKVSFRTLQAILPLLLLVTCALATDFPMYFSFLAMFFLALILVSLFVKKEWLSTSLRLAVYLAIPFLVYLSQADMVTRMNGNLMGTYNLSFGLVLIFLILTLKFTRRKNGFRTTPMDFLILFVVFMIPLLPDIGIERGHLGLLAAKIIVLLFGYEVVIGELRGQLYKLGLSTLPTLLYISIMGFVL